MSDGNDTQTKEQLLAEIAALKEQLAQRDAVTNQATSELRSRIEAKAPEDRGQENKRQDKTVASAAPVFASPMTRRQSIVSWVAPVILSLPVVQAVGAVIKPGTAQAQTTDDGAPPPAPTAAPTAAPPPAPTAVPTAVPTAKPTFTPKPTAKPTRVPTAPPTVNMIAPTASPTATPTATPTRAGRCVIAPTAAAPTTAPSAAPTIGLASTPDSRPIAGGLVPLGGARALVRGEIGL